MKLRRDIPALVLGVLLLAACSQKALFPEPTATPIGPSPILSPLEPGATAPTGPDTSVEFDALLTRLAASGAAVQSGGLATGSFFNGAGHIVYVNDAEIQVFEYKDAAALGADTANVSADGSRLGAAIIDWAGVPHFFRRGTLLAVYVGADPLVGHLLTAALGQQFAGGKLAALPAATATAVAASSTASAIAAAATAAALAPQITPSPTAQPADCTDRAVLSADVTYPDGARVPGGEFFLKTWRLRNSGTCTWNSAYSLVYVRGEQMGGDTAVPFPGDVKPGDSAELSVNLTAPGNRGTYRGYWQLRNQAGKNFGIGGRGDGSFWVEIAVTSPATAVVADHHCHCYRDRYSDPGPADRNRRADRWGSHARAATLAYARVDVRSNALAMPVPTLAPTPATRTTPEPSGPERITFPAGATSVTRQLDLAVDGAKVFILTAHADQLLTISVTQTGASIDVVGPDGAALDATDGSRDGNWTFYLPLEGEYVVLLQGTGLGQVTFTLP